ncbi:hypothetical protein [Pseudomonas aeruginosa]|uniref:hypothetical protein n=1 Tax=Pseudomonas aeruginosa TaxID=287 RepID=UPI0021185586|nr:hypothetical protein [Pseudomonas aeruginosa]
MSNVQPMAPRKVMTRLEREFLKVAGQELAQVKVGGAAALAALLVMIANWHGAWAGHRATGEQGAFACAFSVSGACCSDLGYPDDEGQGRKAINRYPDAPQEVVRHEQLG